MTISPIVNRDTATANPPATQNKAANEFSKLTHQARAGEAASTASSDGKNTSVKSGQSKVQSRGERDQEQGGQKHGDRLTRIVDGVRITLENGHVIGRVKLGSNSEANVTAYLPPTAPNTRLKLPEIREASGQVSDSEPPRSTGQVMPVAASVVFAIPRSFDARSHRSGEAFSRTGGKSAGDFGPTGTSTFVNAETNIHGQQDSGDSSSGGNQRGNGGEQGRNSNGSSDEGINCGNTVGGRGDGNISPNVSGGRLERPENDEFDAQQNSASRAAVPKFIQNALMKEGATMGFDPLTSRQYASSALGVRTALRQFFSEHPAVTLSAVEIKCLDSIASMLPADGATAETMLSLLRQLYENFEPLANSSEAEKWHRSDFVKVLSVTQSLLGRQDPSNRNANTLLEIANALTAPPAKPSSLREISQGIRLSEFSDPETVYPADINTLIETLLGSSGKQPPSVRTHGLSTGDWHPDSDLHNALQYFLDEIPGTDFSLQSANSIFQLVKMLPDRTLAAETLLSMLLTLRANTTDGMQWLSPEMLPTLLATATSLFGQLEAHEREPETLLDLIRELTVSRSPEESSPQDTLLEAIKMLQIQQYAMSEMTALMG